MDEPRPKKRPTSTTKGDESSSEQSGSDDETAKAGSSCLTQFNMREEEKEGHFDQWGTFIVQRDKESHLDSWLTGITKDEIEKARSMKERGTAVVSEPTGVSARKSLITVIKRLLPNETAHKAMARMNRDKSSKGEIQLFVDECSELRKCKIEGTSIIFFVYESTRELLLSHLYESVLEEERQSGASKCYFYWKYNSSIVHGPFSLSLIRHWHSSNFFSSHDVMLRFGDKKEFVAWDEFFTQLE